MTSLQYHCILGLAEIKTLHPGDKLKMQDAQVKKSLLTLNLFYRGVHPFISKKTILFPRFQRGPIFSRRGSNFFQGVQLPIFPIETPGETHVPQLWIQRGGQRVHSYLPLRQNYSIFIENFQKNQKKLVKIRYKQLIKPPFVYLNHHIH